MFNGVCQAGRLKKIVSILCPGIYLE